MMELKANNITLKYDKNIIINNQSFSFIPGKINAIIGRNGSGKTTIFKAITRQLHINNGSINLDSLNVNTFKNKTFAQNISILFQENFAPNDLTVEKLVSYGRFPYLNLFQELSFKDLEIIKKSMIITNTLDLKDKKINELSSGQKQLVWIAMLLAQDTEIMLFDEPNTFLDLKNQFQIMNCLEKINKSLNKTIIIILHDLNLVSQYADYIFMIKNNKIKYHGFREDVLNEQNIKDVFNIDVKIIKNEETMLICPIKNKY